MNYLLMLFFTFKYLPKSITMFIWCLLSTLVITKTSFASILPDSRSLWGQTWFFCWTSLYCLYNKNPTTPNKINTTRKEMIPEETLLSSLRLVSDVSLNFATGIRPELWVLIDTWYLPSLKDLKKFSLCLKNFFLKLNGFMNFYGNLIS